jgi:hypothetical protein
VPGVAGLRSQLGQLQTAGALLEAVRDVDGLTVRATAASEIRIDGRLVKTLLPTLTLTPTRPLDAHELCVAWGLPSPIAVSHDAHQASWHIALRGADQSAVVGTHVEALPVIAGRWTLLATLAGRPDAPLPVTTAGASPAYDLRDAPGAVVVRIEVAPRWQHVATVSGTHPDAIALTEARRTAYPHWAAGWDIQAADQFVVRYAGHWPVAGAAISHDQDAISRISRLCVADGADGAAVAELLDVLEALAVEAGSTRIRLDSSAFLADAHVPWQRSGYGTGPPYDGNADVDVWVERTLDRVW